MKPIAVLTLALATALSWTGARAVQAAKSANPVVALATGDTQNNTLFDLFVDSNAPDASQMAQQVQTFLSNTFSGELWQLTDKDEITVGNIQNNQFQAIFPTFKVDGDDTDAYYVIHVATGMDQIVVNGSVWRDKPGAATGGVSLDIVLMDGQGGSFSAHIEHALAWQDLSPSGTTGGSGGTGGTGSGNPSGL